MEVVDKKGKAIVKKYQLIVFKLAGQEYAFFIDQIKEVVITPNITPVPLTPSYIKGVANVRGDILAIADLEERFDLKAQDSSKQLIDTKKNNFTLVIASDEIKMGILVKELPNTLTILETDMIQPSMIYEHEEEKNYILSIVKLQERLIIVIDLNRIILKEDINTTVAKI
ncbi:MAG: purine-binding chemotaxis protein CheW [Cytophagales bacterium]|nr:MAG: purine-binding chemotaxis protein CheW [Cytophagales bacterium]